MSPKSNRRPRALTLLLIGLCVSSSAASAVTPGQVSTSCGPCHGLTVNGITVSSGPGSLGFTSYISGRDQTTWVNTITRMIGHGAVVSDVNGTAAYLANLGQTTGLTATPTPTGIPPSTPTPTARPKKTRRVPSAATYQMYCASCHDPSSAGFVGQTIFGATSGDINEALAEVPQMQFLQPLLSSGSIHDITRYLRARGHGSRGGGENEGAGSRGDN
ncbi:MAG: hypothetical protein HY270_12590 [Deltaproteobacteria bacterium]|nr:hypothetical protein [Deltaproteobacteria bacterium]